MHERKAVPGAAHPRERLLGVLTSGTVCVGPGTDLLGRAHPGRPGVAMVDLHHSVAAGRSVLQSLPAGGHEHHELAVGLDVECFGGHASQEEIQPDTTGLHCRNVHGSIAVDHSRAARPATRAPCSWCGAEGPVRRGAGLGCGPRRGGPAHHEDGGCERQRPEPGSPSASAGDCR